MKAAVFVGEGKVEIEDRAAPEVRKTDDVVVKVAANGLCGSDLRAFETPTQKSRRKAKLSAKRAKAKFRFISAA